ncbi:unnamed protein product [Spodoptera exigua]|nr:unnamed protein product [Spodoptera exigua]
MICGPSLEQDKEPGGFEDHQVFHKWAQLSLPRNPSAGAVGFLKVDISIVFRGDIQVMPVVVQENRLEDNLLLPSGAEQQPANYIVTVYGAFGLPNGAHGQGDRRFGKLPSTFVRVSFCGLSAKTAVQARNNHPVYCEQISIVEMFPTMSEMIRLEVCSGEGCFNRVLGSANLKLSQVSHDGENGFLPTFGPSLLHMYGATTSGTLAATGDDGPYHRGAMLVSLKTLVPYYQQELRSTSVEPVSPLQLENLWLMEDFCMFCPILEVSMLDRRISGKLCGIAITVGELPTDDQGDEEQRKLYYTGSMDVLKTRPVHGYLDFENTFPVLQLAMRLPDFRFRMYRNNMVHGIVTDLEQALTEVERRLKNSEFNSLRELTEDLSKAVDDTAGNILKFLDIIQYSTPGGSSDNTMMKYSTELDNKQVALQKEEIEKIYQQITKRPQRGSSMSFVNSLTKTDSINSTKRDVKLMLADTKQIAENLKSLIYKPLWFYPPLTARLMRWLDNWLPRNVSRILFRYETTFCVIHKLLFRVWPLKCPKHMNTMATGCCCIAGKVELILWMGLYRQIHAFEGCLPKGYKLKVKDFDMCLKTSTMVQQKTLTPIWNQVLKIHKLVSATHDRIQNSPPLVMVEVLDSDQLGKSELIGRLQVQPVVDERLDYLYAPKLQWYDLFKGAEYSGQILMSAQLCQDNTDEHATTTDKIVMYGGELEAQPEFGKFKDWCTTLKLYNGKKTGIPEKDDQLYCGFLKAGIAIYRWPPPPDTVAVSYNGVDLNNGYFTDYPNNEPSKFLVRVYIVRGVNLVAKAFSGKLDPYVAISCGSKHLGDRKNHVKNTLNPIFGKMYEFRCTLPDDYLLTVSLYDYDAVPPDELIGSTTIDLEDRIYSKHRARVGLSTEYNAIGPNKWRDCQKPSVILEDLCAKNHLAPPIFPDNATVVLNGVEYRDNDNGKIFRTASDRKENICLSLLHSWHTLPICGYRLVPEHVECRSLINATKNGLEQGKLQMWVDIFPLDADVYIPPGVDITPRKLEEYELRVIIWDVQGLRLDDHGKKVSDIYVRAWIDTIEQAQYTDVHYSSSSGEGSFNWRMIFHFHYHHAEKKLVRKEKGPFTEVEEHMPPIFVVQVLDSDALSQDDFLASVSFNLNSMSKGTKQPTKCMIEEWDKNKKINLFTVSTVRGWWPLVYTNRNTGMTVAAGSIDLELTLLPRERAVLMPVGLGREPPAPLPEPTRSESTGRPLDFVKSLKFSNWKKEHKAVAGTAAVITFIAVMAYLQVPMLLFDVLTWNTCCQASAARLATGTPAVNAACCGFYTNFPYARSDKWWKMELIRNGMMRAYFSLVPQAPSLLASFKRFYELAIDGVVLFRDTLGMKSIK